MIIKDFTQANKKYISDLYCLSFGQYRPVDDITLKLFIYKKPSKETY